MAIKSDLPDGSETDMVLNSLKFCPVSNAADFRYRTRQRTKPTSMIST